VLPSQYRRLDCSGILQSRGCCPGWRWLPAAGWPQHRQAGANVNTNSKLGLDVRPVLTQDQTKTKGYVGALGLMNTRFGAVSTKFGVKADWSSGLDRSYFCNRPRILVLMKMVLICPHLLTDVGGCRATWPACGSYRLIAATNGKCHQSNGY
jgi:hypothetical protein